ncbi:MAG: hypothetical protein QNJ72_14150 [Pleurocapsa sp. MO_226.B13]|nr:hypothetical protein [Pleurocapsa sp. MO_226.B13]
MTFDAIKFEQERDRIFRSSQSIHLEISSQHNYSESITYYYLHAGDMEIGQYYRDPWGDGWYWMSSISGEKAYCHDKAIALTQIQLAWLRWSR